MPDSHYHYHNQQQQQNRTGIHNAKGSSKGSSKGNSKGNIKSNSKSNNDGKGVNSTHHPFLRKKNSGSNMHGQLPSTHPSGAAKSIQAIFQLRPQRCYDERITLEEWLHKRSNSLQLVWKRRWCVLRDSRLYYYRSNNDTKPLGVIHLADYAILTSGPDISRRSKFTFRLSSPESIPHEDRHHIFHVDSPQALELWIEAIQGHINHAQANLSSLGPLDLLGPANAEHGSRAHSNSTRTSRERPHPLVDNYAPHNSKGQNEGDRSIIDKVLDRLHLEDPTLSDMNDPSTLIIPAPEHHLNAQQQPGGVLCMDDDNLDGWSTSPSSTLYNNSNSNSASTSTNTSMSLELQQSPIGIHGVRQGLVNHRSGSQSQGPSAASSFTDMHSNYSSYSEIGLAGSSIGNKSSRTWGQALESQGRTGRSSHGYHSPSSSLSNYYPQQQLHLQSGYPNQQSPTLYPLREKGNSLNLDMDGLFVSTSAVNSPLASPKMTTTLSSCLTAPTSPGALFYRIEPSLSSSLSRRNSSASSSSISTLSSSPGGDGVIDTLVLDPELTMTAIGTTVEQQKKVRGHCRSGSSANINSSTNTYGSSISGATSTSKSTSLSNKSFSYSSIFSKCKCCADNDLQLPQISDKEAKGALALNGKKSKKLRSVSGGSTRHLPSSSSAPSTLETKGIGIGGKKTDVYAFNADNPMLKGLALITPPSKKQYSNNHDHSANQNNNSSSIGNGNKGFSMSMTSLTKGNDQHYKRHVTAPLLGSSSLVGLDNFHSDSSRTRLPSVSVLDGSAPSSPGRPSVSDILSSRLSSISRVLSTPTSPTLQPERHRSMRKSKHHQAPSSPIIVTAPISLLNTDWTFHDADFQQPFMLEPRSSNESSDIYNITQHIVAPDELAMAIEREVEERKLQLMQQQQQHEKVERRQSTSSAELEDEKAEVDSIGSKKSRDETFCSLPILASAFRESPALSAFEASSPTKNRTSVISVSGRALSLVASPTHSAPLFEIECVTERNAADEMSLTAETLAEEPVDDIVVVAGTTGDRSPPMSIFRLCTKFGDLSMPPDAPLPPLPPTLPKRSPHRSLSIS
ncbi:hypothetical protein BG011_000033 [Mortierella polycephala]|uniref:PH domain-containing protein n=1 Tax=Mortierella polycephala TaxID=41804 RepID=A0A9P6QFV3_9FUNG|nr:hypothetical protein BG011_000033 [Mortierella polycephala]